MWGAIALLLTVHAAAVVCVVCAAIQRNIDEVEL